MLLAMLCSIDNINNEVNHLSWLIIDLRWFFIIFNLENDLSAVAVVILMK